MVNILSIDWDYFIPLKKEWSGSYIENNKNINFLWYKRYFEHKNKGEDLESSIIVDRKLMQHFLLTLSLKFYIEKDAKLYVSDSHKFSYYIAKNFSCDNIYSFDAHTDLGYGGLASLKFEVNCGNWLGKLFDDAIIKTAYILLSPFSFENSSQFKEINNKFDIRYIDTDDIYNLPNISIIHIARSGAWTPPWLDHDFFQLIDSFDRPYKVLDLKHRYWNPKGISLADILPNIV